MAIGALTKSAKAGILYIDTLGRVRAHDWSTMFMSPWASRTRERTTNGPELLGRSADTFVI